MLKQNLKPFEEISQTEKENVLKSKMLYRKEIRNYIKCFELLYGFIEHIGNQSTTKKIAIDLRDSVVFSISGRIVVTSKAYLDLAMKGYYYDGEIIYRSLLENLCFLLFFVTRQDKKDANENAKKWFNGELKLSTIKKELDLLSNKPFSLVYGKLSDYVHSNFQAVKILVKYDDKENRLDVAGRPIFRPDYGRTAFNPGVGFSVFYMLLVNFDQLIEPTFKSQVMAEMSRLKEEGEKLRLSA
jgi:hypothetical protein